MIYKCPSCSAKFKSDVSGVVQCPSCGANARVVAFSSYSVAWDEAHGAWTRVFFETAKYSIVDPISFFKAVAGGTGWIRPWLYAVIISTVVFLSAVAFQAGMQALAVSLNIAMELKKALFPFAALSIPISIWFVVAIGIIAVPIFVTAMLFLQSAVCHGCLMMLGAAKRDYWTTFRTICYAHGPQLFQIIPFLGGMVGPIWQLVLIIIGLKVTHDTSYGRSALALFLPTILCCGVIMLIGIVIMGGIFGAVATGVR